MMGDIEFKTIKHKIGFIGGGNMAKAICEGLIRAGRIKYSQVYVSCRREEGLISWKHNGANISKCNGYIVDEADVIFLAVKPTVIAEAIAGMMETCNPAKAANKLFISILAGVKLETLETILSRIEGCRVMRVMPNTPLMVGEGCAALCPGQKATESDIALVKSIFDCSGLCELVPESMINAIGALAGSGPAFMYLVIEAMADGALKMGLPREMATRLAAQTMLGSAKMVLNTGKHTGVLKDEVCSPGGTTITGVYALEKGGVRSAFIEAIEAATRRSVELGDKK